MKKFLVVLVVLLSLLTMSSCSLIQKYVCYYGYFKDSSFILVYSSEKNTLYEISIPPEVISQWGRSQNIASIPDAMRSFANLNESGFMLGTPQTLDAVREILNALSAETNPTIEDRLEVLCNRASDFASPALLSKMNSLCGTDLSALANVLKRTGAKVGFMDAANVVNVSNAEFSQKYFAEYLKQVIYK